MPEPVVSGRAATMSPHRVRQVVEQEVKGRVGGSKMVKVYTGATIRCTVVAISASIEAIMLADRDRTKFRLYFPEKPAGLTTQNWLVVELPPSMAGQMLKVTSEVVDDHGLGRSFSCLAEYRQEDQQLKPAATARASARRGARRGRHQS